MTIWKRRAVLAADQAAYSLTNFALTFGLARALPAAGFGRFSLLFVIQVGVIALARSVTGENLALADGVSDEEERGALSSALAVGVGFALIVGILLWALGWHEPWMVVLLPGLAVAPVQDAGRYIRFADGRAGHAVVADVAWLTPPMVGLVTGADAVWLSSAWSLGATISAGALWTAITGGRMPSLQIGWRWIADTRTRWGRLAQEALTSSVTQHGALIAIALTTGTAGAGGYRGAQMLYAPIPLLLSTLTSLELASTRAGLLSDARETVRTVRIAAAAIASCALAGTIAFSGPASRYLHIFLGDSARLSSHIVIPIGLMMSVNALSSAPVLLLRAAMHLRSVVRARTIVGSMNVIAAYLGGALGGLKGAGWSIFVANIVGFAVWEYTHFSEPPLDKTPGTHAPD